MRGLSFVPLSALSSFARAGVGVVESCGLLSARVLILDLGESGTPSGSRSLESPKAALLKGSSGGGLVYVAHSARALAFG